MTKDKKHTEEPKLEELSGDELDKLQGGAGDRLVGSYNFKVEINGVTSGGLKPKSGANQIRATGKKITLGNGGTGI